MKLSYWGKIKRAFKEKKTLKVVIWATSEVIVLIITWLVTAIYTADKPKIVPEETRGAIREGIKEHIGEPIKSVSKDGGDAIINAAYKGREAANSEANDWKRYKNEEYGYELRYPEGYNLDDTNKIIYVYPSIANNQIGIWLYPNNTTLTAKDWWEQEKTKYSAVYIDEAIIINGKNVIKSTTSSGLGETHYIFSKDGNILDVLLIGPIALDQVVQTIRF